MKHAVLAIGALLLAGVLFLVLAPRNPGGLSIPDRIGQLFDRRDSLALVHLERRRAAFDSLLDAQRLAYQARVAALRDSLAAVQAVAERRRTLTAVARQRADSLVTVLRRHYDDDEVDTKYVEAALAQKDSVIEAQAWQLEASTQLVRHLETAVAVRDSQISALNTHLAEAIAQRDAYRKRSRPNWLRSSALVVGAIGVCKLVPGEQTPC